ncbi:DUF4833 domain-containing protein [Rubrolithibacter danxiaensis]|uniref:DUF4833 domain-containing protein n=1 Tax=Rubrolithibacter danxiaensis TaxID=3390805 RepID=UPI003BF7B4D6
MLFTALSPVLVQTIFGAPQIALDTIDELEKSSPNILVYALPLVLLFTLLEFFFSHHHDHHKSYEKKETIGSVLIGTGNLAVNLALKVVLFYGAVWLYNHLPWRMMFNWWTLVPCFILYDFCSYWAHRISHFNRFFWATHVVHHSAEHYNLTVSFRQSWVQHFKLIFFLPVALLGFHPVIFFIANQLSVLYQFWVHTESIGKLHPFIEKYFGTPSNHRVHHGSQEKYLDKNFGATFMIWDHLFNSFQYEKEKPVYGITTKLDNKINPFILNFHEYADIIKDVKQAKGWRKKLFFLFASPDKISRHKKMSITNILEKKAPKAFIKPTAKFAYRILLLFLLQLFAFPLLATPADDTVSLPSPKGNNLLFYLQRDPDANTVIYELNYRKDGTPHPSIPVKGSWIRYSENGQHKDLNAIERKFAYGIQSKAIADNEYEIKLVSYKKQPMYLKRTETGKYVIYTNINKQELLLKRVFVRVNGGSFWFPKVEYIELAGIETSSGKEVIHRIKI